MRKLMLVLMITASLGLAIGASGGSNVSVEVESSCAVNIRNFEQPGRGSVDPKIIGQSQTDYFTGEISNHGNSNASVDFSLQIFREEYVNESNSSSGTELVKVNTSMQNSTYNFQEEIPAKTISENKTQFVDFTLEFKALYEVGNYTGRAVANYTCGQGNFQDVRSRPFKIINARGDVPDRPGEDTEVDQELDLDAIIERLRENGTLDTDINLTINATPQEGDSDAPGVTPQPQPEPEPEPEPIPLLGVELKPSNTTYEIPRGGSAELSMMVENVGEETLGNLSIEPRLSEGLDISMQGNSVSDLETNSSVNSSVYASVAESVERGIYQVPVYAVDSEGNDIGMEYFDIRVTDEVTRTQMDIAEAPRNINLEQESNYTIPVLIENPGTENLTGIDLQLENLDNCGEYRTESIDYIAPGETASASIYLNTSEELNECEGNLLANSESGQIAFSEIQIDVNESVGVVPERFRVPIVATLWTVMLLAYSVASKKFDMENISVKLPLILLVVGEAFIVIYLASAYYGVLPPQFLPF
jgi:hypothetical protein